MEEILASIRRIIADEDTGKAKPAAAAPPPSPKPEPVPPPVAVKPAPPPPPPKPPEAANNQADIDAMLASVDVAPVAKAPPPPPAPPPKPVAPPAADVLDLTEAMTAPPAPSPVFRTIDAASDIVFAEGNSEPTPEPPRMPAPPPMLDRGLMSNATQAAVDHAFSSLASTVLGNNARTLEDLVKEMLRPMLKGWLDDNLPGLVERIVRAEIERVSRGGR